MVHEYFKKEFEDFKVLVQVNPANFAGQELTVYNDSQVERRKIQFDEEIFDDLAADDFQQTGPLEFNLYLKGLT